MSHTEPKKESPGDLTYQYYIFGCHEEIHSDYTFFQESIQYTIDANEDQAYERINALFIKKMKYVIDHDNPTEIYPRVYSWYVTLLTVDYHGKIMNGCLQFSFTLNKNQERTKEEHKLKIKNELIYYNWPGDEVVNNIPETPTFTPLNYKKIYLVYLSAGDVSLNKYICRSLQDAENCYKIKNLIIAPWYAIPANKFRINKMELNNLESYYNVQAFEMDIEISGGIV